MKTKEEVEKYLSDFRTKSMIFGIVYRDDRKKNTDTLLSLDIIPSQRTHIVLSLTSDDFSEVVEDTLNKSTDMWIFGKEFKKREIYIKITMGGQGRQTICISFHLSEHPIKYQFK